MRSRISCLLIVMTMLACDPLEVGDPPQFNGFSAKRITGSQIELSWDLATDDFLPPEELPYAIWFAEVGGTDDLNLDGLPAHITGDGAFSFNLIDLKEDAAYEILVRAKEPGATPVYSENQVTQTVPAGNALPDIFENETVIDMDNQPTQLFGGNFITEFSGSLGVVLGDEIDFYQHNGQTFERQDDISPFRINATIVDAQLNNADLIGEDELFVLTAEALLVYPDSNTGTPIRLDVSNAGSLGFAKSVERDDTTGEVTEQPLVSIRDGSIARIYTVNFDDDTFDLKGSPSLGDNSASFRLADLDADGFLDIVSFGNQGLKVFLGRNDEFDFDIEQELDDNIPTNFDESFFLTEGDDTNLFNVYIFLRNSGDDETRLWVYRGLSDGTFSGKTEIDYGTSFYSDPVFADYDGNGTTDLIIPQTSSNNVAVYDRASGFQTLTNYYGGSGTAELVYVGALNNVATDPDMAILSNQKITFFLNK